MTVLRRDLGAEQEPWLTDLQAQPFSLAISRQGDKIAVGYALGTQLFDAMTRHSELLPSAVPKDFWDPANVDSQCLSFSSDSTRLAVATREAKNGSVFTGLHNLVPGSRQNRRMGDFNIPIVSLLAAPDPTLGIQHSKTDQILSSVIPAIFVFLRLLSMATLAKSSSALRHRRGISTSLIAQLEP